MTSIPVQIHTNFDSVNSFRMAKNIQTICKVETHRELQAHHVMMELSGDLRRLLLNPRQVVNE